MKTIKFISAIALVLGLAACDYDLPNPPGQSFPEPEGYLTDVDVEIKPIAGQLDLVKANEEMAQLPVATVDKLVNFPEQYNFVVYMEVASDDTFTKTALVPTTIQGKTIYVNPDNLNAGVQTALTKEPGTYHVNARYVAYAELGNTKLRLGGIDGAYSPCVYRITTLNPATEIEDAYYLVVCNPATGEPDYTQTYQFVNTEGNVSPYDNPQFRVKVDIPTGTSFSWFVAPASTVDAQSGVVFGANPAEDQLSGKLGDSYDPGVSPLTGDVIITINMDLMSYEINPAVNVLYPSYGVVNPGKAMNLYTNDYVHYTGVTALNQQWTLYLQPDKKSGQMFKLDENGTVTTNGYETLGDMELYSSTTDLKTSYLVAPVKRVCLYYTEVNMLKKTYNLKALETLSIISSSNGWNVSLGAEKATLTNTKSDLKGWTATDVEIKGNIKVNANIEDNYFFGGTAVPDNTGKLVYNLEWMGEPMTPKAGKYDVQIDFSNVPYVMTLTPKN